MPFARCVVMQRAVTAELRAGPGGAMPTTEFGAPLAGSLLPFIDKEMEVRHCLSTAFPLPFFDLSTAFL